MATTRLKTPLSERLGLEVPIFQAPMASVTTAALAAAVSKAGGLGAFGCAFLQPDAMRREVAELRAVTDRPFQLNFFVAPQPEPVAPEAQREAIDALAGYYRQLGLPPPAAGGGALRARPRGPTGHRTPVAPSGRYLPPERAAGGEDPRLQGVGHPGGRKRDLRRGGEASAGARYGFRRRAGGRGRWPPRHLDPRSAGRADRHAGAGEVAGARGGRAGRGGRRHHGRRWDRGGAVARSAGRPVGHGIHSLSRERCDGNLSRSLAGRDGGRHRPHRQIQRQARARLAQPIHAGDRGGTLPAAAVPRAESAHGEVARRLGASRLARLHGPWAGQAVALSRRLPAADLLRELERETLEAIDKVAKLRRTEA